jgi:uncharacterized membrane protein
MNTKTLMVAFMAVLAVFALSFTSALTIDSQVSSQGNFVNSLVINVDGVEVTGDSISNIYLAAFAGETVPVKIYFSSNVSLSDVEVEVELNGKTDSSDSYFVGNVVNDSRVYRTGIMNLQVPSKLDERTDNLYLIVTISANGVAPQVYTYQVSAQRNSYDLRVLSVDYDASVAAGDTVPVSVVVKNLGFENSEDGFVLVAVPELGISAKGYFGDLVAIEDCNSNCDDDNTDAAQKIVSLKIPSNAKDGTYEMVVKVYDDDAVTTVKKQIAVSASTDSQIVSAVKSQDLKAGETKTIDLILVNSGSKVMVYNLNAASGSELAVSVPSVVTVDAGSAKTIQVTVTAASDAEKGVYPFTVTTNGQTMTYNANVTGSRAVAMSAVVLTAILVIIFVVLLAVLIILLTRKSKPAEEVETSYY